MGAPQHDEAEGTGRVDRAFPRRVGHPWRGQAAGSSRAHLPSLRVRRGGGDQPGPQG